jgi:ubiquinone/menaquinone biosynthesis C-methylase UbiE
LNPGSNVKVGGMETTTTPNHHHGHAPFAGPSGLLLGLAFAFGRNQTGDWAADLAGVTAGDVVVDIGCGPGNAARVAQRRGATAIGVDPAAVMLKLARVFSVGRKRLTFRHGTAEHIPVDDAAADVVWSLATVHHWKDIDRGLTEVRRVLKPNGVFVAIEADTQPGATGHASHGWTDAQAERFAELCRVKGYIDVRVERRTTDKRARVAVIGRRG